MEEQKQGKVEDLSIYKLQRAQEDYDSARILLDAGQFRAANNRAYYAVFHAVDAVLALDMIAFKKHKDTIAYFNKHYVHTGVFPADMGRKIARLEVIRHKSDYDDFYIVGKEEAAAQVQVSTQILKIVKAYITERIDK